MAFSSPWQLERLQQDDDIRTNPNDPDAMQIRGHFIVIRYHLSDQGWVSQQGTSLAVGATVGYYVGSELRAAPPYTGKAWRCTSDEAVPNHPACEWRTIRQTWESYGDWATFTPP